MAENKTVMTSVEVASYIDGIDHEKKREEARTLDALFQRVTGFKPRMWGPRMVGYGSYHYVYDSGREGDCLATGFATSKARHVMYIMPGYTDFQPLLDRIGKYKMGKACLYINKLADVDMDVLAELIDAGLKDLGQKYPVTPT